MPHGPLCSCGCFRDEHRAVVEGDATGLVLVFAECLTCSECARFDGAEAEPTREGEG